MTPFPNCSRAGLKQVPWVDRMNPCIMAEDVEQYLESLVPKAGSYAPKESRVEFFGIDDVEIYCDKPNIEGMQMISINRANRLLRERIREEHWVPSPRSNSYLISSYGKVRHIRSANPVKSHRDLRGYHQICFHNKTIKLATLVAEAFYGPKAAGMHVAHLDGNKENNHAFNLAYVTPKENAAHKSLHGTNLVGERHHAAKLSADDVRYIRKYYKKRSKLRSNIQEFVDKFGLSHSQIRNIASGKGWKHIK